MVKLKSYVPSWLESYFRMTLERILFDMGFNVPPTAKVIWRRDVGLLSHRIEWRLSPETEHGTPGLQCK